MTGPPPPPPPPPGMSGDPYPEPERRRSEHGWAEDLAALAAQEAAANLGTIRLGRDERYRVAIPEQLRVGIGLDLLVVGAVAWIAWLMGVAGIWLLSAALVGLALNSCVLQGLTGRSIGKWINRTQLTYVAVPSRSGRMVWTEPYFAVPGVGRCAIRLLTQIVMFPVLFRVRRSGSMWVTPADDLNAVIILSPPVRLRAMQEGDKRDYQMLPPWELWLRDRREYRR